CNPRWTGNSGPSHKRKSSPHIPNSLIHVQKYRACSQPVCPKRTRKHLHPNNESHNRRFREKSCCNRRRNRLTCCSLGTSSHITRTSVNNTGGRRNRFSQQPLRRNL